MILCMHFIQLKLFKFKMIEAKNKCFRGSATPHTALPHHHIIHIHWANSSCALSNEKFWCITHSVDSNDKVRRRSNMLRPLQWPFAEQNFAATIDDTWKDDDISQYYSIAPNTWLSSTKCVTESCSLCVEAKDGRRKERNQWQSWRNNFLQFWIYLNCMYTNNSHVTINSAYLFIVGIKWINSPPHKVLNARGNEWVPNSQWNSAQVCRTNFVDVLLRSTKCSPDNALQS